MKNIYLYKNINNNTYFTEIQWHDGKPDLTDSNKIENAKKFSDKECLFSKHYIRIPYEEEYKKTLKCRRKEKLEKINETERDI